MGGREDGCVNSTYAHHENRPGTPHLKPCTNTLGNNMVHVVYLTLACEIMFTCTRNLISVLKFRFSCTRGKV